MGIVVEFAQPILIHPITVWGFFAVLSAFVAYKYLESQFIKHKIKLNAFDLVTVVYTAGLFGSKLHSVAEGNMSGMNYQGGLMFATLGSWILVRRSGESVSRISDLSVVAVLLGHGIGRCGCFFSGDGCYGIQTTLPWGMSFPNGHIKTTSFVHPVPLYEVLVSWTTALILHNRMNNSKVHSPWDNTSIFLAISGITRFLTEFVRRHEPIVLGLSSYQIVSIALISLAVVLHVSRPSVKMKSN